MQVITLSNSLSDRVHSQTLDIKKKKKSKSYFDQSTVLDEEGIN